MEARKKFRRPCKNDACIVTDPQKILLVHLYSNGDCLYATAVAKQIKHDFPGCHLTWAIARFCKSIISNNPYVDEVMEIDIAKDDAARVAAVKQSLVVFATLSQTAMTILPAATGLTLGFNNLDGD